MKNKIFLFLLFSGILQLNAQNDDLKTNIENILKTKKARVGVAITVKNETVIINNDFHYPMQSVFKFPIALAVLSQADRGKFSLDQKIIITKKDLLPETWSPIRDKYPDGTTLTLSEIIEYTVSQSDNNGCDILLRLIGGSDSAESFLKRNHFENISIKANEEEMHRDWDTQYRNWTTPAAMNDILRAAYYNADHLLSVNSHEFIWRVMTETTTGPKRLKGQLPENTIVAHKTGSSGSKDGFSPATNDVGVIILPDQQVIFISVLVADSKETPETNEKIISDIAKLAWDYWNAINN